MKDEHPAIQMGETPATIGRGTGFTLKQMNQRLNQFLKRRHADGPPPEWKRTAHKSRE